MRKFIILLSVTLFSLTASAQPALKSRLEQHVYTLASDSLQGRAAGSAYARMAADYIVNQFREIGIESMTDSTYLQKFRNGNYQNIVGIIRGTDDNLKNEYIVVGAHYDHLGVRNGKIYNGADDNASGVATLIELGRALQSNVSKLKRSIVLVAFDAEEIGLVGSKYFIDNTNIPVENIKLMISVDMVGWYKASGKVEYMGSGTIQDGTQFIENQALIPDGLHVTTKKFENSIFTATDTEPFAVKGIPTLAVTTGIKSPYHKPEDDAELIDYEGIALITRHLKNVITDVSSDEMYAPSGKLARKHKPQQLITFGVSLNAGSNFHYYTDGAVNGKRMTSYGAGIMTQVNFGSFAIRPEVHYERVCAKHPAGNIATNNLTVPLSLVMQSVTGSAGVDVFGGGYYTYRFNGKQGDAPIDFENTFNRQEFGFTFGVGMFVGPIKIGLTNRVALTNFTRVPNADNAHLKNRTSYFTATYLF